MKERERKMEGEREKDKTLFAAVCQVKIEREKRDRVTVKARNEIEKKEMMKREKQTEEINAYMEIIEKETCGQSIREIKRVIDKR